MRKAVIASIVCVGILAACSGNDTESTPVPTVTVTEKPVTTPAPSISDTDEMVNAVRIVHPDFNAVPKADIITVANQICDALRSGTSLYEIGQLASDNIGNEAASALTAGAITYICPDQEYLLSE